LVWFWPPCAPPGPTPGRVMFVVCGADVPIAGPPGAGDGGGSSGTALTAPMDTDTAEIPTPTRKVANLVVREMFMMFIPLPIWRRDRHRIVARAPEGVYPIHGRDPLAAGEKTLPAVAATCTAAGTTVARHPIRRFPLRRARTASTSSRECPAPNRPGRLGSRGTVGRPAGCRRWRALPHQSASTDRR
jgi:hypothetical protein